MEKHYISWWNVENLFDVCNSTDRPAWLQKKLKSELKGWTQTILNKKISQLTSVISQMNDSKGPDIIGLCEVENKIVVEKLLRQLIITNRNYRVVHQDMNDKRGIDIAFIYDKNKYDFKNEIYSYELLKRSYTRDILQVEFHTKSGNSFIIIGNHWPARRAGKYKSEPYRMMAGETLSYWLKRIQSIRFKEMPILVVGDFNDSPFDRSLQEYALSTHCRKKVINGRNPFLYNLMWELMGKRAGSYFFNSEPQMLDQFLATKGLIKKGNTFQIESGYTKLEIFSGMTSGSYKKPKRFGRPSKKSQFNLNGFSDHFPISLLMTEK